MTPLTREQEIANIQTYADQHYRGYEKSAIAHVMFLLEEYAALQVERDEYEQQRNKYVLENITLTAENERVKEFVQYTYDCERKCGSPLGDRAKCLLVDWGVLCE